MTPSDPDSEFRDRKKTTTHSVEVSQAVECKSALPPSPFLGPDRDADRVAHRPAERAVLAREALTLAGRGLMPRDIAAALGLSGEAVRELLDEVRP
jgi:hypothetical protein